MRAFESHRNWLVAVALSVGLVAAAVLTVERTNPVAAQQPTLNVPSADDARSLSTIFRSVAKEAMPAVVSISTKGKAVRITSSQFPFGDDSPFGELFKNDPRFRDMFRNLPREQFRHPQGKGSGFIIDKSGIIMTNNHVVNEAEEVVVKLYDGREFIATDVKTDPRTDVAIVRIDAPGDLQAIRLGNSDAMEIGDWVLAVGSPFGLDMSVTAGIISGKSRGPGINEREDYLQTDAAINPGNSGGPLLNLNGEVIGINTAISSRGGGSDGIGFAIPINMARWVADQLMTTGKVQRAYLGVSIQPVSNELAEKFGARVNEGAIVAHIMEDSPASASDLRVGDVILELDGKQVSGPRSLQGIVEMLDIDKSYDMVVLRDGKRKTIKITVRAMPEDFAKASPLVERDSPEGDKESFNEIGLELQTLTPELARRLGAREMTGVVITDVLEGSAADRAGLRSGMVIRKVGTQDVASVADFEAALKDSSLEEGVLMLVHTPGGGSGFIVVKK